MYHDYYIFFNKTFILQAFKSGASSEEDDEWFFSNDNKKNTSSNEDIDAGAFDDTVSTQVPVNNSFINAHNNIASIDIVDSPQHNKMVGVLAKHV